jgi:hypothetical protein
MMTYRPHSGSLCIRGRFLRSILLKNPSIGRSTHVFDSASRGEVPQNRGFSAESRSEARKEGRNGSETLSFHDLSLGPVSCPRSAGDLFTFAIASPARPGAARRPTPIHPDSVERVAAAGSRRFGRSASFRTSRSMPAAGRAERRGRHRAGPLAPPTTTDQAAPNTVPPNSSRDAGTRQLPAPRAAFPANDGCGLKSTSPISMNF